MTRYSGIVRRIDDLGRIAIPAQLRKQCGFQIGEPLEIFVQDNNVVFTKYMSTDEIEEDKAKESEVTKMDIQAVFNNFDNFTIEELNALNYKAGIEIKRRREVRQTEEWRKVVDVIKDYVAKYDTISVFLDDDEIVIDNDTNFQSIGKMTCK